MAKNPTPIRPRVKDMRAYELALRRAYLNPMYRDLVRRLARANAAQQAWRAMDQWVLAMQALPQNGVPVRLIQQALNRMQGYHRQRVEKSFRAALGVDVRPFLADPPVLAFMTQQVQDNVALIKTIPPRLHASLRNHLNKELQKAPFDQQRLRSILKHQFKSSGYNLRRLTRDQTNKTIGGLTQIRQQQLGVEHYQWLTSQDERVRPSHVANSGRLFDWATPPPDTGHPGHDILCRCTAVAVLTKENRDRLKSAPDPHSITTIEQGITPPPRPPAPPAAPPTPSPALAVPPPAPKPTYQSMNTKARLPAEEDWHKQSWNDTPEDILRGVVDTPALRDVSAKDQKAWYMHYARVINMGDLSTAGRKGRATWRHEFGHHMDHMLRRHPEHINAINWKYDYSSASKAFRSAKTKDRNLLKKTALPPKGQYISTREFNHPLNIQAQEVRRLGRADRKKWLTDLADEIGVELDDVRTFLTDDGILGGPIPLSAKDQDTIMARFMLAWKQRDVQGAMDVISGFNFGQGQQTYALNIVLDLDVSLADLKALHKWANKETGYFQYWSDMADVLSVGRIKGGWGHSTAYFNKIAGRRDAEIFANMVTMMSTSPFTRNMVEHYHPNLYKYVMDQLAKMKDVPTPTP